MGWLCIYVNPASGIRHFLSDEVVVRLKAPFDPGQTDLLTAFNLELIDTLSAKESIYVFRLVQPKNFNPFRVCHALVQRLEVVWAEPNRAQEFRKNVIPNDALFGVQWHLLNTGQSGAFSDADVDADEAWDGSQGYGSPGIRIAILDDGVQTTHPDLAGNIVPGYDFFASDSDPNPSHVNDNHGTAVAGIAAAVINNGPAPLGGVAGMAGKCKILPVRIGEDVLFASAANVYRALVYGADNADVISCSWTTDPSSTISSGFSYAWNSGRGGKGCPVLCASGNSAAGFGNNSYLALQSVNLHAELSYVDRTNCRALFEYNKNASESGGDDCWWLADVTLPDQRKERFDSAMLPAGWANSAFNNANWTTSIDPEHAHGTTRYAWRSGVIGDLGVSGILSPLFNINSQQSTITYRRWVSSAGNDSSILWITDENGNLIRGPLNQWSGGVDGRITAVSYPANLTTVLAVGASGDFDYRSAYSQYGAALDFVFPSSGGYGRIVTTDRTGNAGYDTTSDYFVSFGGTSASAPGAAGVAALILSKDGNLTRATVVSKLNENCDKIGPIAYTGTPPLTRNDYYGYGRLNAKSSVNATTADTTAPSFNSAQTIHYRAVDVTFSEPMGEGAEDPTKYQIIAGADTLTTSPNKVLRIKPTVYRLIWNSGDIATSGTVTIKVLSGVKDVAGNLLPANVTQNSTGTKRIVAINAGNYALDNTGINYLPPYFADHWQFQGNEFLANYLVEPYVGIPNYTYNTIDTSGVTDPAPQAVYATNRRSTTAGVNLSYSIPGIPSVPQNVRFHFAEFYYNYAGDQVFDIKINGTVVYPDYDILGHTSGTKYIAVTQTFSVTPGVDGLITIDLVPKSSVYWTASVNGIEVLKP